MLKVPRRIVAGVMIGLAVCFGPLLMRAVAQSPGFDPPAATVGNARLLARAFLEYTQDYDEHLPPTRSVPEFQAALHPYVPNPAVFISPETRRPFVPNPAISGQTLTALGDPGTVKIFQDTPPTGVPPVIAFLDGHIERNGVEQGDPNALIVGRAHAIAVGALAYAQDHDGLLPPMNSAAEFQAAVSPYVPSHRTFYDLNGRLFVPNAALSGVALASLPDPATAPLLHDSPPYVGGQPTIAYADGHVTHGTLTLPQSNDRSNLNQIGLAVATYEQDNGQVPPTTDMAAFRQALAPYGVAASLFVAPDSGLPYVLNPAVGGRPLSDFPNPTAVELLRDPRINNDGTLNTLSVVGTIQTRNFFLPTSLLTGPDDLAHLFWRKPVAGEVSLWTLTPTDDTLTTATDTLTGAVPLGVSFGGDGLARLLWDLGNGAITLTLLGADGVQQGAVNYGPYDGWSPLLLATGQDNESRLLWQRYDGVSALWRVSPAGDYLGSVRFRTQTGRKPVGLARGSDARTRLLWRTTTGAAVLWTLSPADRVQRSVSLRPPTGFSVAALALGPDNLPRLLWDNGTGQAEVWTLSPAGRPVSSITVTLGQGFTARSLTIAPTGHLTVLAIASDGTGRLLTLLPDGTVTASRDVTPYQ